MKLSLILAAAVFTFSSCSLSPNGHSDEYPLTTCVVSGDSLDAMGGPVEYEYDGKKVMLCCDGCIATFDSSPDEFLAEIYDGAEHAHKGDTDHGGGHDHGSHDH